MFILGLLPGEIIAEAELKAKALQIGSEGSPWVKQIWGKLYDPSIIYTFPP